MRVEQLLHGYSDGHRQLAASTELSRAANHAILGLSDMSGRSMLPGFEEYVTAYPVPTTEFYAVAKTWYAPEMERPGCVWTHTLLLAPSHVAEIEDIGRLTALFRRPAMTAGDFDAYCHALEIPTHVERSHGVIGHPLPLAVLAALYGRAEVPVLVPVISPHLREHVVFAIWNQQWPRLRRSFAWCTGAISSRSVGGRPMDLQLVPESATRELGREVPTAVLVQEHVSLSPEPWLLEAGDDLAMPNGRLRQLFCRFGDALGGRQFFQPLVELHECVAGSVELASSLDVLIELVVRRFPNATDGRRLKAALLGRSARLSRLLFAADEPDILRAIAASASPEALDAAELDIAERARRLWTENRDQGEQLADALLNRDHNALGEEMLTALVSLVPPEQVTVFFRSNTGLLLSAVRRDPKLATSPALWSGPADLQRELFDAAVAGRDPTEIPSEGILTAMLNGRSDAAADQAVRRLARSVDVILDWFSQRPHDTANTQESEPRLSENWQRCLRDRRHDVLTWAVRSPRAPRSMALVAQLLDPHAREVADAGLEVWIDAVANVEPLPEGDRTRLHAFALALAFDVKGPQSSTLAVLSFETVHAAAAARRLGYEAWSWFEEYVPTLSKYRNWDKCERLRRGLVDRFDANAWPIRMFVSCARQFDTFSALLRTCDDYRPAGKSILQRLSWEGEALIGAVPSEWSGTLRRYVRV